MEKENNTVSGEKNENSNSKGLIFWAGLSFVIPLTLIYFYSYSQHKISISGIELKKIFLEEKQCRFVCIVFFEVLVSFGM